MKNYFKECCYKCTKETGRSPGCHSTCNKYLEARELYEKEMSYVKTNKKMINETKSYVVCAINNMKNKK